VLEMTVADDDIEPGDWVLEVEATLANGRIVRRRIGIEIR